MADDDTRFFGARRDWSLRKRFWALDSYGLLLLMIMVSLVVGSFGSGLNKDLVAILRMLVLGGTFLFALHTSGANRSMYYASFVLILIAIAASVIVARGPRRATPWIRSPRSWWCSGRCSRSCVASRPTP